MYPSEYFRLFPPFPRDNRVFVAMSFHPDFDKRWENVIAPGIRRVARNGVDLEPFRVDVRRISDSILTEILTGISRSLIVFADVTTLGQVQDRPIRNGNVMYEVGLAHAIRLPEEVVIFRSDSDQVLFDVANVRINTYDPDNEPERAQKTVAVTIAEAIKEVDLKKHLSVRAASESLDYTSWEILLRTAASSGFNPPPMKTMRDALGNMRHLSAISRLLELGALKTDFIKITPEILKATEFQSAEKMVTYQITEFGTAIIEHVATEMGFSSPEVLKNIEQYLGLAEGIASTKEDT